MALSPKDLVLNPFEIEQASILENSIDIRMKENFGSTDGTGVRIAIPLVSKRILNEVIRRYEAAGWKEVEVRDGGLTLIFKA